MLSDGSTSYLYGHERLAALGQSWSVGDALGSVRQTLDGTGGVLATTSYDPWGVPQYGLLAPFGFTGELHAQERVYLRARWYAPGNGTLTSRDPFAGWPEQPYSLHPYQYAYSAPTVWTDPSGLDSGSPIHRMIQAHYGANFRFLGGTYIAEYPIYLSAKTGLTLDEHTGSLSGAPSGNIGYVDILDIVRDIGYIYEIKHQSEQAKASAEVDWYITVYAALPQPRSPTTVPPPPRRLVRSLNYPEQWQIIGTNPLDPSRSTALLARMSLAGVIIYKAQRKSHLTEPVPYYVWEYRRGHVMQERPDSSWLRPIPAGALTFCAVVVAAGVTTAIVTNPIPGDELAIPAIWSRVLAP